MPNDAMPHSDQHTVKMTTRELQLISRALHKELLRVAGNVLAGQRELKSEYEELDALIDKLMTDYFKKDLEKMDK